MNPTPVAAAGAVALDPTLLVLLSIFGGALVSVIGGIAGSIIQAHRTHKRWIRERRYEAWVEFMAIMALWQNAPWVKGLGRRKIDYPPMMRTLSEVIMLGPKRIVPISIRVSELSTQAVEGKRPSDDELANANAEFYAVARNIMKIDF